MVCEPQLRAVPMGLGVEHPVRAVVVPVFAVDGFPQVVRSVRVGLFPLCCDL